MTQKRYVMRHGDCDTSDRYFDKEHFDLVAMVIRVTLFLLMQFFICYIV